MQAKLSAPAPQWRTDEPKSVHWELKTITPMFGGGAETREIDAYNPIRAASIRGHLRFWWRATAGTGYADAKALYDAEKNIWGDTDNPGKVIVRVEVTKHGKQAALRDYLRAKVPPDIGPEAGYFLFPFDASDNYPLVNGLTEIEFNLSVKPPPDPSQAQHVHRALEAWIMFGGVGARTRRGCGAIAYQEASKRPRSHRDTYLRELLSDDTSGSSFPLLAGGWMLFRENPQEAVACWKDLGRFWSWFRKGHFTEKRPVYNSMNGGEWRDHATLKNLRSSDNVAALAKPTLGLPLIYQNKNFRGAYGGTLNSEYTGRMASPIILKPVAFADGVRPMVACLNTLAPEAIRIAGRTVRLQVPTDDPVLKVLHVTHPLDAVREAAKRLGFRDVREGPL